MLFVYHAAFSLQHNHSARLLIAALRVPVLSFSHAANQSMSQY